MVKVLGILLMVLVLYGALRLSDPNAGSLRNHQNIGRRIGTAGILVLGVAPVIICGGIDLSIGSVLGLSAVCFSLLLGSDVQNYDGVSHGMAVLIVLACAPFIGLIHGLLITKLRLQPFLTTLCGLFIARGLARWIVQIVTGSERSVGLGRTIWNVEEISFLATGHFLELIPWALILFLILTVFLGIFLHFTMYGRYLFAIGANEQASRYAGISTDKYKILAYMWCSTMAALGGILYMLEVQTANPASVGSWKELYAITGAVLGGCSLRGGEGNIIGVALGATILPLLSAITLFAGIPEVL